MLIDKSIVPQLCTWNYFAQVKSVVGQDDNFRSCILATVKSSRDSHSRPSLIHSFPSRAKRIKNLLSSKYLFLFYSYFIHIILFICKIKLL